MPQLRLPDLPRLLVIDDVLGRSHPDRRNEERASLCGDLLLRDVTDDEPEGRRQTILNPMAEVVFVRGQRPSRSVMGDTVENDLEGCLGAVRAGWTERPAGAQPWSMVFLDLCFYTGAVTEQSNRRLAGMPEGRPEDSDPSTYFGLTVLSAIRDESPDLPVVILSSKPREDVSRAFSQRGALAFLPTNEADLKDRFRELLWRHGLLPDFNGDVIGCSVELLAALRTARRAGLLSQNVLLQGERGTGKELLAKYLHKWSGERSRHPLVSVDSGVLTPELFASELFGHTRGSFTGAVADRKGKIELADGGDLFLDEIGNMAPNVQAGLMRVLQERTVFPVGANQGKRVDVRFISATNQDVDGKVVLGQLKGDLLDRLRTGGAIRLPPLRSRRDDIPLLVGVAFNRALGEIRNARVQNISHEAVDLLCSHDWPGNVRTLQTCVRGAVINHPDVDFLFPIHFELPGRSRSAAAPVVGPEAVANSRLAPKHGMGETPVPMLGDVIESMSAVDPEREGVHELRGSLQRVQHAYARLVARLVRAGLIATRRPSVEEPEGKVLIQPAMRLLKGEPSLSASSAADMVKRLLGLAPEAIADLTEAGVLREAMQKSLRLRPRGTTGRSAPKRRGDTGGI